MKKTILLSLAALMTLLLCASCKSDKNEPKPVPNPSQEKGMTKKIVVDASDYTKWVYINFDKGEVVSVSTPETDLMADIPTPKDSEWALDREGTLLMKFDMSKHEMKYEKQSANFLLTSEPKDDGKGYLNKGIISRAGMPPTVTVDPSVFLVRSATGQIVRVRVLDYQNATKKTGYITLEYIIKADKK